jgi:hypothetical protein
MPIERVAGVGGANSATGGNPTINLGSSTQIGDVVYVWVGTSIAPTRNTADQREVRSKPRDIGAPQMANPPPCEAGFAVSSSTPPC